jgi:DNA helicase-2/ATP-dependent DNA helicase PcrA
MLVRHERYGLGRVIEAGGRGALRKVRIRFQKAGERTFLVNNVDLEVVQE